VSPRQQRNWDWRAAANFICRRRRRRPAVVQRICRRRAGIDPCRDPARPGLIGWRPDLRLVRDRPAVARDERLSAFRHILDDARSVRGAGVFPSGALALLTLQPRQLVLLSGILGLAFLYSQARILAANKGIPAWRHPAALP
jgi:phenylacetyl-CoA:acceptor oxidoreductase subunit 2